MSSIPQVCHEHIPNAAPIDAASHFADTLPARPRCANDPATDNRIRIRSRALGYRLIEPNTAGMVRWLMFDVDRPGAVLDWEDLRAPAPTLTCQNPENGHAHLLYALAVPVARTDAARLAPLRYAEAIERSLRRTLMADRGYARTLVKNPLHPHWRVSQWADAYTLGDLASELTLTSFREAANDDVAGLGRNCDTFDRLRQHAYRVVRDFWGPGGETRFRAHLIDVAGDMQSAFITPLPHKEVEAIAKSVARWTWKRFTPETFRDFVARTHTPEAQARRGTKKGKARRDEMMPRVLDLIGQGKSQREVARALGLTQQTVGNWLKRAR
ncbi:replication initiation protein [Modicisalibacter sp. 'Wilcox']|uniref:replication initiation protein n=1 Tax=Modicisalibacter sp. 'Wilcox' TaxID=2679914 RepID=UPI0013D4FFBD|nr:replication initiation protein [Modicisalibacter sp. 'Wilcox']